MQLKRGIQSGTDAVVAAIRASSTAVSGREGIAQIATISAADPEIGELVAEVLDKVGRDGVITVEEAQGIQTEIEYVEGMQLDRGYISPHFVTDTEHMEASLENPYVLITDKKISAIADISADYGAGCAEWPSRVVDHCRGCGWRSAGNPGGQ